MKSDWFVLPTALERARLAQLLNQEQLAKKSGVSVRSIRGYEQSEQRVKLATLQFLAKALDVDVRDIAALRTEGGDPSKKRASAPPPEPAPSVLPPRTQLETLVDLERAAGIVATTLKTPRGDAETLTAKLLQDILTAYALYDDRRFLLDGKITGMRGIAHDEAKLLGSRNGVAARFHVAKEVVPGQPFGVTVHAAKAEHTKALQAHYGGETSVRLHLRVVLVPGEPRDDGPGFSSFITRLTTKRPWTFLVEEAEVAKAEPPAKPAKKKAAKVR
jgi:transcriptional regulator with XRE-family HTH domain